MFQVLTKTGCAPCAELKLEMSKRGLEYEEVLIGTERAAPLLQKVLDSGIRVVPVLFEHGVILAYGVGALKLIRQLED